MPARTFHGNVPSSHAFAGIMVWDTIFQIVRTGMKHCPCIFLLCCFLPFYDFARLVSFFHDVDYFGQTACSLVVAQ